MLMPRHLQSQPAFVRNPDLLQRPIKSDLKQLGYAGINLCNRNYINENVREDMRQYLDETFLKMP